MSVDESGVGLEGGDATARRGHRASADVRYQRFTRGRCETTSRAGFQICPQPPHRQYVVSEIDLLVVVTAAD
jgi:hypothetical protein